MKRSNNKNKKRALHCNGRTCTQNSSDVREFVVMLGDKFKKRNYCYTCFLHRVARGQFIAEQWIKAPRKQVVGREPGTATRRAS